ncbi:hypothetical protein [Shewanella sp.]|uniref:hypothetical protein n=1 Tax=Shewanella sp. TaxID=50422 RepID=UPI001B70FB64|nr:hypothetical protein [Shewanella sp.]MBP6520881.1 hypothetical protein [Shewanella sp.]
MSYGLATYSEIGDEILWTVSPFSLSANVVVAGAGVFNYAVPRPVAGAAYHAVHRFGGIADDDRDDYIQHGTGTQYVKQPKVTDLGGGVVRIDTTELGQQGGQGVDSIGFNLWAINIYAKLP